jgi:hypothetical protein
MVRGWFVGDFEPSVLRTAACEVGVRHYREGDCEALHHHRLASEITVIVSGEVEMLGRCWRAGDIVLVEPGDATAFRALSAAVCVVVKTPGVLGDKFEGASGLEL